MKFITMDDVKGLKDGDKVILRYLSNSGEIYTSEVIIFREAFLRGKNMVVINYNENRKNAGLSELSSIISVVKK